MRAKLFLKLALGMRVGGAISKNSEKTPQWGWFFIYSDEKFDNNNKFPQKNNEN